MGFTALWHSLCTFENVSSPERVVKSIQDTARKSKAIWKEKREKNLL